MVDQHRKGRGCGLQGIESGSACGDAPCQAAWDGNNSWGYAIFCYFYLILTGVKGLRVGLGSWFWFLAKLYLPLRVCNLKSELVQV